MECQAYLKSKKRHCLKYTQNHSRYCRLHQGLDQKPQQGGATEIPRNPKGEPKGADEYISPYMLKSSKLPPNPNSTPSSWYHYQAPNYQNFGDYVCIKKSFLNSARDLVHDMMVNP